MALISLLLIAAWTVIVVRLVAVRATLSDRTLVTFLVAGALLGPIAYPLTQKLLAPYNESGPWIYLAVSVARQIVLLSPVLMICRGFRALSIADAFLLAFLLGFGFDLSAAVLAAAVATQPIKGLALLPPWQFTGPGFAVAGYGYWTALVALAFAASQRFLRKPKAVRIVTGVVFLWVVIEAATLLSRSAGPFGLIATLTLHGKLTAALTLVAVAALSVYEAQWAGSVPGAAAQGGFRLLTEWQSLLGSLAGGKTKEYVRLHVTFALQRQSELAHAESHYAPADQTIAELSRRLQLRLEEFKKGAPQVRAVRPTPFGPASPWRDPRVAAWASWLALFFVIAIIPKLPANLGNFFWSFSLLHYRPANFPLTILNAVLVLILLGRCLLAAGRPMPRANADDVIQFRGEDLILKTTLGIVLAVLVYGKPDLLYPFSSMTTHFAEARLPNFNPLQVGTLLLLLATALSSITVTRMLRWRRAPIEQRRQAAVRNALQLATAFIVVWVLNAFYPSLIVLFHLDVGWTAFNWFGASGNYVIAIVTVLLMGFLGAGLYMMLASVSRRIERFFAG